MRLNMGYRNEIVRAAISAAFDKDEKELTRREHRLAQRCYDAVVPLKIRRAVASLPDGWLPTSQAIRFNIGGQTRALSAAKAIPVSHAYDRNYNALDVVTDAGLVEDVRKLTGDVEDFRARRKRAEETLTAMVNLAATTQALEDVWPEGKKFWRGLEARIPVSAQLPAVRIAELNVMLGLREAA